MSLIYGGHICPELRRAATKNPEGQGKLPQVDSVLRPFYARIESIATNFSQYPSSLSLLDLHQEICDAFKGDDATKNDAPEKPEEPESLLGRSWYGNGGMVELVVESSLKAKDSTKTQDGKPEEAISREALKSKSRSFSISIGHEAREISRESNRKSEENYQYGKYCAGMCQQLIDKLRGSSRRGYTKPKTNVKCV